VHRCFSSIDFRNQIDRQKKKKRKRKEKLNFAIMSVEEEQIVESSSNVEVPEVIKNFILYFNQHLKEKNVFELHSIYESSFSWLTERYYKKSCWPPVSAISDLVHGDDIFLMLYRELYFRHICMFLSSDLM
jgi:translation initiation factor 3 subunit L